MVFFYSFAINKFIQFTDFVFNWDTTILNVFSCDSQPGKTKLRSLKSFVPFTKRLKQAGKNTEGIQLTKESICQVYQLINFLSKEESKLQKEVNLSVVLNIYIVFM